MNHLIRIFLSAIVLLGLAAEWSPTVHRAIGLSGAGKQLGVPAKVPHNMQKPAQNVPLDPPQTMLNGKSRWSSPGNTRTTPSGEVLTDNHLKKNSRFTKSAFRSVVARAANGTVRVFCDKRASALGVVVGNDGWVVTKGSELQGAIECQLCDGRRLVARIMGTSDPHDLTLLRLPVRDLAPVTWSVNLPDVGSWVATPDPEGNPLSIGIVSLQPRCLPQVGSSLGIRVKPSQQGVRVRQVIPGTGAAEAGIRVDDTIIRIEDERVGTVESLIATVRRHAPGDQVMLEILRSHKNLHVQTTLGYWWQQGGALHRMRGLLSDRRENFPCVFQHDSFLTPRQCGGPLCDLEGNVVGINIARADRVASYAIPAETVRTIVRRLQHLADE